MPKRLPLSDRKRRWAQNRNVTLRGTKLNYNVSQQRRYKRELLKLVEIMTSETETAVMNLFKSSPAKKFMKQQAAVEAVDASIASVAKTVMNKLMKRFDDLFSSKAKPLAESMVENAAKVSASNLNGSLKQLSGGLSLKTGAVPAGMEEVAKSLINENVNLIKSIPEQYLKDVSTNVFQSITFGQGIADLVPAVQKAAGVVSRRTRNIALDQTRKAYNSINKQRMTALGVKKFEWIHSGGGQYPRESHLKISGKVFSFENLEKEQAALGVPEADRGIPGQAINCRCTMTPVLNFDDEG